MQLERAHAKTESIRFYLYIQPMAIKSLTKGFWHLRIHELQLAVTPQIWQLRKKFVCDHAGALVLDHRQYAYLD